MRRAAREHAWGQKEPGGELAAIGADYPGWHPWRSSIGRPSSAGWWRAVRQGWCPWRFPDGWWWAARKGQDWAPPGAPAEWAKTVYGRTPAELRAALAEQEGLAGHARQ
jgi:hypothetical protein